MILVRDDQFQETVSDGSDSCHTVIYVRVNPRQKNEELEEQERLCRDFSAARGWIVTKIIREKVSGIGSRKKLLQLIATKPNRVVICRSSVLSRFDTELLTAAMAAAGCELVVIDRSTEVQGSGGALEDLADAISVTCHRHYGQKRGRLLVESLQKIVEKGM
ncbi:MAG: recombinase family protein [Candidatus Methylacidiphilales bacterium]|nr:recombinase family protein [Candidatus Methylacidiphilales bacterium]